VFFYQIIGWLLSDKCILYHLADLLPVASKSYTLIAMGSSFGEICICSLTWSYEVSLLRPP
jgi:hypothetical protein